MNNTESYTQGKTRWTKR